MKRNTVTIKDVARLADVSPATVSNVLNGAPNVGSKTRQVVLEAVEKLNYRPNTVARSLRKSHTHTIAIVAAGLEGRFIVPMMAGVEHAASREDFNVLLGNSYQDRTKEKAILEMLLANQVAGIILMGTAIGKRGAPALPLGSLPVVYLYQYTDEVKVPCVIPDDFGGGKLAAQHLIRQGYGRIGLINGPLNFEASLSRLDGYKQALAEADIAFDRTLVRTGDTWYPDTGYRLANELLLMNPPPAALFCASDTLAEGAMAAICEKGLRIPQDIAMVGFDNDVYSAYRNPPLTSVALPLREMGSLAAALLLAMIRHEKSKPIVYKVDCPLFVRESCGGKEVR